jgi:HD-like signal output (HDOD) protein
MIVAAPGPDEMLPEPLARQLQWLANTSFMLPAAARKALDLARDPDCDVEEFLIVVRRDPKLAADILMLANTGGFATGQRILSLQQAVVRLGFRQCRNLILTAAFATLMTRSSPDQQAVRQRLWRHSFATAMLCQVTNRNLGLGFQGEEVTAGLIHDFGCFALASVFPELCDACYGQADADPAWMIGRETAVAGADHGRVGAWLVRVNGLPEALELVVRHHHDPTACPSAGAVLCDLVAVSAEMARHLILHRTEKGFVLQGEASWNRLPVIEQPDPEAGPEQWARAIIAETLGLLQSDPLSGLPAN